MHHTAHKENETENSLIFDKCFTPYPYFIKYHSAAASRTWGIGSPRFESGKVLSMIARSWLIGLCVVGEPRLGAECAECHGFEAERASPARTNTTAVVVHVRDRDARRAELVERRLASCGFAVEVADARGLDGTLCGPWIERGGRERVKGLGRTEQRTLPASGSTIALYILS